MVFRYKIPHQSQSRNLRRHSRSHRLKPLHPRSLRTCESPAPSPSPQPITNPQTPLPPCKTQRFSPQTRLYPIHNPSRNPSLRRQTQLQAQRPQMPLHRLNLQHLQLPLSQPLLPPSRPLLLRPQLLPQFSQPLRFHRIASRIQAKAFPLPSPPPPPRLNRFGPQHRNQTIRLPCKMSFPWPVLWFIPLRPATCPMSTLW